MEIKTQRDGSKLTLSPVGMLDFSNGGIRNENPDVIRIYIEVCDDLYPF